MPGDAADSPDRMMKSFSELPRMTMLGELRANGIRFGRALREEHGLDLQLLFREGTDDVWGAQWAPPVDDSLPWVHRYRWTVANPVVALTTLVKLRKLVASHPLVWGRSGGGLLGMLLGLPYVMQTVGSDVADMQFHQWWLRRVILRALRRARLIMASQIRHLPILRNLGLNHVFLPLPVWEVPAEEHVKPQHPEGFDLVFFTCTPFYWKGIRELPKGNDRFLRGFARFVKTGANVCLVAVEHGLNIVEARQLIQELGISDRVFFLPKQTQRELAGHYAACDVVVDNFVCGEPGLATMDSMPHGVPAMAYVDPEAAQLAYQDDLHPIVNVSTDQEIFDGLVRLASAEYRQELGSQARAWWRRHHHPEVAAQKLLVILNEVATGYDPEQSASL